MAVTGQHEHRTVDSQGLSGTHQAYDLGVLVSVLRVWVLFPTLPISLRADAALPDELIPSAALPP